MGLCIGDIALSTRRDHLPLPTDWPWLSEADAALLNAHHDEISMANGDDNAFVVNQVDIQPVVPLHSYYGTFVGEPDSDGHNAQVVFTAPCSIIVVSLPAGLVEVYPRASLQGIVDELECKIPTTDMSYVGRAEDSLGFAMKQLRFAFAEHGSVSSERGHTSR